MLCLVVRKLSENRGWTILLLSLVFNCYNVLSSDFEPGGKPEFRVTNPNAEAIIGAVVNVRDRGSGLFGCGDRKSNGVAVADALRWSVDELNGKLWSGSSSNVSLGLHIMDSCGRTRTSASQLAEFLPELRDEDADREIPPFKIGVVDDVGFERETDVSKALEDLNVPVVETSLNVDSVPDVIDTACSFVQELRWENFAVVHSNSVFSSNLLKAFTKSLKKHDFCVPWIFNVENAIFEDDRRDLEIAIRSNLPILALLPSEEHELAFKALRGLAVKPERKINVLFTDLVLRRNLKLAEDFELFSMIPFWEKLSKFEEFHSKNSIATGVRIEDELELMQRSKIARKINRIVEKLSESLGTVVNDVCRDENRICSDLTTADGRNSFNRLLGKIDWAIKGQSYGLIKYQYQFSDGHVHLRRIMSYNNHNNLDVFEPNLPIVNLNCDNEIDNQRPECRCLEIKNIRTGSARNIADRRVFNEIHQPKNPGGESVEFSSPEISHWDQNHPTIYSLLKDPLNATLSVLTLLGALLTLFTGQYFATFAALPSGGLTTGTSVVGYFILIALFLLYSFNLAFILTPTMASCAVRRFGPSYSYAMIFSGMMIKVWTSWKQARTEKSEIWKPSTLISLSLLFSTVQALISGLWLILIPPKAIYDLNKWTCYPSADLDSHLLVSMVYVIILLFATAVLAIRTCSQVNNSEARWILISSALVAIIFSCWGISVATGVWQTQRTACTNLSAATILLLCLYIPKIKLHSKLKKAQTDVTHYPTDIDKEYTLFAAHAPFPVMLDYNLGSAVSEGTADSSYSNQAYSIDDGTESMSIPPFEFDSTSFSEPENEQFTFSTFLEEPQNVQVAVNDPTQVVPSNLYPLEMFSTEPAAITKEHHRPGTNEFTPPHRTASQMYLSPAPEWVP